MEIGRDNGDVNNDSLLEADQRAHQLRRFCVEHDLKCAIVIFEDAPGRLSQAISCAEIKSHQDAQIVKVIVGSTLDLELNDARS